MAALTTRLAEAPADVPAWIALGLLFLSDGEAAQAARCADRALTLRARDPQALLLLGRSERALGRPGLAWLPLEAAAEALPDDPAPRVELGAALLSLGRHDEAADALATALSLPGCPDEAHALLGSTLYRLQLAGKGEEAVARARAWEAAHPGHPLAGHTVAALGGAPAPALPGDSWVRLTFDRLADGFDRHLAGLGYDVPRNLTALLAGHGPVPGTILDIGCGTGLCGPLLRPLATRLEGVDLSPGMLAEAARKGVYDALHEAEAAAFMRTRPEAWDVAVAADVLIYIGDTAPLLHAAAAALRPGGILAVSIEDAEDGTAGAGATGWTLHASGRYRHAPDRLRDALAMAGLQPLAFEATTIRMERGAPIPGHLVLACRPRS
ncbi:class I SAM-dependent DNA methyltransferase [Arenibaculum pallidiluteum]|uniref:class I SAM-dependent DNA methyltransferase n=1 Tax=Arenibaculum pallidiluteum TaxID=2812559 RepID=UPI001A9650AC|nr:methyltransferase domain-containing protein [Arenibaculum pallidiluteum]